MKTLHELFNLSEKIAITIPTTANVNEAQDTSNYTDDAMTLLGSLFGGATAYQAQGAWISEEYGLVKEAVTVVQASAGVITEGDLDAVITFAERMAIELNQEAVALEHNGKLYFIEQPVKESSVQA